MEHKLDRDSRLITDIREGRAQIQVSQDPIACELLPHIFPRMLKRNSIPPYEFYYTSNDITGFDGSDTPVEGIPIIQVSEFFKSLGTEEIPKVAINSQVADYPVVIIIGGRTILSIKTMPDLVIILNDKEVSEKEFINYLSKYE